MSDGKRVRWIARGVLLLVWCILLAWNAEAGVKRILIVGDSWAQGIFEFKVFETVLASHGLQDIEVVGKTTALGGSRADQWASNQEGKLDALDEALKTNPTVDIVHLSIGGNDFLNAVLKEDVCALDPKKRAAIWARICKDIGALVNHILAQRRNIHVLLNDYDYLDPVLLREKCNLPVPENVTPALLNTTMVEFAKYKCRVFRRKARVGYINHFGLLQYYCGVPPDIPKASVPLPGDPPKYKPFPGGNPAYPNSPEAMPDGVHPYPRGYEYIVEHCFKGYYKKWLKKEPKAASAPLSCRSSGSAAPTHEARGVHASSMRGIYDVTDYGAKGDGKSDDTQVFQAALNAASRETGGGLVRVPAGQFLIASHLNVPDNVTLEGIWRSPQRGEPVTAGTVLLAVEGKGDPEGTPFIVLNTQATLTGITIYYPQQVKANPPHPYPWSIATRKFCDNPSIINVTIINPYQAVDFGSYPAGRHYINGLYAYPLLKGLYVNQCYDVGRIENVHFWPFWDLDPKSPLWEFTRTKGTAFIIGKTDGEMASNCFSIFYNVGMHFIRGPIYDEERRATKSAPGSGVYTNCYMDVAPCAIKVDEVAADTGVSFVNGMFMSGVEVGPENKGQVKFTGCGFWATKGLVSHAKLEGRGTVFFESCHFSNWDQAGAGAPCIAANSRQVIVNGCEFSSDRRDHLKVRLGPLVQAGIVTSNIMGGGVAVENQAPPEAAIEIAHNAGNVATTTARNWVVIGPFPNSAVKQAVAGKPPRAGYDIDYLASLGGEAQAVLIPASVVPYKDENGARATATAQGVEVDGRNRLDLKAVYQQGGKVAYAFCYIRSGRDQKGHFLLGANDGSKVWVNGELMHSFFSDEGGSDTPGAYQFEASLHRGLNPVLVKVEDAGGSRWGFTLDVFDARGGPLADAPGAGTK